MDKKFEEDKKKRENMSQAELRKELVDAQLRVIDALYASPLTIGDTLYVLMRCTATMLIDVKEENRLKVLAGMYEQMKSDVRLMNVSGMLEIP